MINIIVRFEEKWTIYEAKELRKLSYFNTANLGEIKKIKFKEFMIYII